MKTKILLLLEKKLEEFLESDDVIQAYAYIEEEEKILASIVATTMDLMEKAYVQYSLDNE